MPPSGTRGPPEAPSVPCIPQSRTATCVHAQGIWPERRGEGGAAPARKRRRKAGKQQSSGEEEEDEEEEGEGEEEEEEGGDGEEGEGEEEQGVDWEVQVDLSAVEEPSAPPATDEGGEQPAPGQPQQQQPASQQR